ncbi:maternal embryonic leucine zipper kinase-like [Oppia nitens]|uniref:maternal embryonic leucine zipper kinase-like n=1 Tax=Oppia nitens TaxID=1686743 RepID=UPI0023DA033F|nr:maternal embryonic leucine zipper kinase-like [Oppia nitens]
MSAMVGPLRHAVDGGQHLLNSPVANSTVVRVIDSNEDNCLDLGYYLHRNKLGEGGFGKVRLATHLKTGHKVAVKIMNKQRLGSDLCRVRVEINSLKVLRHENIAKLLQVIETKDEIYLILEYCSGGELFDYLVAKSRLSENETKTIMNDLINALAYIHSNGFAHRDLKPENILFDANHKIKLIDFGLAANQTDNNNSLNYLKTCCGSPAYAAPELLQGPNYSGPAVDVWSAGVLLYALLVGRLPFDDENISALYKKIQSGVYRMPDVLSADAKDLIRSMLKTNPLERITIDKILSHPWLRSEMTFKTRVQIMRTNFDEEVFFQCHRFYPEVPLKELRQKIMSGFGYLTATYWLLKMNSNTVQQLPPTLITTQIQKINMGPIQRRRSRSLGDSPMNNENDIRPKLKRKFPAPDNVENQSKPSTANRPKFVVTGTPYPSSPINKIPVFIKTPINATNGKDGRQLKEIKSPMNSPVVPSKKARLFNGHNDSINGNIKSPLKSPLQELYVRRDLPKTPMNTKIECTPKKSLLKRFLETATPAKSLTPRAITTSTASKNITLTKFTEPQQCINKLVETLSAKGIQCKQKDFSLRCAQTINNTIILSFNLEICKFDNQCVIQRKRLKGDAWNYKKACEEILRISNE